MGNKKGSTVIGTKYFTESVEKRCRIPRKWKTLDNFNQKSKNQGKPSQNPLNYVQKKTIKKYANMKNYF